jgi:hypothetical protein
MAYAPQMKANQTRIEQFMWFANKQFTIKSALIEQRGKQIDSNGCKSEKNCDHLSLLLDKGGSKVYLGAVVSLDFKK